MNLFRATEGKGGGEAKGVCEFYSKGFYSSGKKFPFIHLEEAPGDNRAAQNLPGVGTVDVEAISRVALSMTLPEVEEGEPLMNYSPDDPVL